MASASTAIEQRQTSAGPALREETAGGTQNVGDTERLASVLGGGALAAWGLADRSFGGLALAFLGSALLYRGATGHCPMYQTLGVNTANRPRGPAASIPAGRGVKVEL